ncbi:hypothetical protein [Paenibacillus sp. YIM B09110]|uniref:hypothetical protein n=1 Tax=Paenibacillus sp. YIM B09110 TaxID=3126102 RepID=UPI00301BD01F
MSTSLTEQAAKASLIHSIAKSQHALARILDSIANVAEQSPETAKLLRDNIRMLTDMQRAMAEAMIRTEQSNRGKSRRISSSNPGKAVKSTGSEINRRKTLWSPRPVSRRGAKTGSSPRKAGSRHGKK